MANDEHLKILKQGVDAWIKWREENPETRPDLSGAPLWDTDLSDIDLSDADLNDGFLMRGQPHGRRP